MIFRHWLFLVILFVFIACDVEKLTSFSYHNVSGKDSTSISGHIFRKDTGEPVFGAVVTANLRKAVSDSEGYYFLPIQYNDDINRNLPVPLVVSAKSFSTLTERLQIIPEPISKSFDIVWGVPIINDPKIETNEEGEIWATALITDYQGVETIMLVKAYFVNGPQKYEAKLTLGYKQDVNTGYFKSHPLQSGPDPAQGWEIEATDEDGHVDFLSILRDGRIIRRDQE